MPWPFFAIVTPTREVHVEGCEGDGSCGRILREFLNHEDN